MRKICDFQEMLKRHVDKSFFGCFGHVGCMSYDRLVKKIYDSMVEDTRRRGRPQKESTDVVSELYSATGISERGYQRNDVCMYVDWMCFMCLVESVNDDISLT